MEVLTKGNFLVNDEETEEEEEKEEKDEDEETTGALEE